jgi:sigma-B regulation protein RsbU (phosphoserine phosphatase)
MTFSPKEKDDMVNRDQILQIKVEDFETLRHETSFLKTILNSLTEGVIVADQEGKFVFFNPAAERILGIGSRSIALEEWSGIYGCYRVDKVTPYPSDELPLARSIQGETVLDEIIYILNDGHPDGIWISTSSNPLFDGDGKVNGGVVIFREVMERQFQQRYERLALAVEQIADSIVITNMQGVIEYVNPAFEETTGYSRDEALGETPRILKSGYHDQDFYQSLWGDLLKGQPFRGTILNKKKNGELYWAEQTITPIRDNDGNILNFVSVLKDVTEIREKHEQDFQLNIARKIQQQFYPAPVSVPGFDIAGAAYPANETGGDYFDYIPSPDGGLWIVVGDVSGHGISSALVMAETRAYLRSYVKILSDPGEILSRVNQELIGDVEGERFVTMILVLLDPSSYSLTYACAGHVPGYLIDKKGEISSTMGYRGMPLGVLRDYSYSSSERISLHPSDVVVLLTDGITETIAPDNEEFGSQRAVDLIHRVRNQPAVDIVEHLYQAVKTFSKNRTLEDDVTSVICKVL